MAKVKKTENENTFENIEGALSRTEQYIEDNQKSLTIILAVIFVLFGGYYGYKNFILGPKQKEALSQMYMAEKYFEQDSFNLAINGDGNFLGFEDIKGDYGITKSANLSNYYIGISHLKNGNYEEAIESLKDFDASDVFVAAISLGAIGDAYSEMEDYDNAISYYKKAVQYDDNNFTSPIYLFKLGLVYEETGDFNNALSCYKKIQDKYPSSIENRDIEKYITRADLKAGK